MPRGFQASGVASGIKRSGKLDLGLFASLQPAKASCKFTTNRILAAPIQINKRQLQRSRDFSAILVNSGNANCFNGQAGLEDAEESVACCARSLGVKREGILVASTGIIGRRLPVKKIQKAMPELIRGLSGQGMDKAKRAILTTDTFAKEITVKFTIGGQKVTICGVAKGAGMIAPNMATMLAFIFTDACLTGGAMDRALGICVEKSFNCITVDGCMSTNDSVMMLANAEARNKPIGKGKDFDLFVTALGIVCLALAKMIVRDAEGGTKFIEIRVRQAASFKEARILALAVANSNLFKTAVYGENPNFGRILSALGVCGIELKEERLKIRVSPLRRKEIIVDLSVGRGDSSAIVYASDLTPEYIRINAEYN